MDETEETARVLEIIRRNNERAGGGGSDIYSSEYRHDIDNDSSTDEEPEAEDGDLSSDEDDDFTSKYGKIATQTSRRGKVRIKAGDGLGGEGDDNTDPVDDMSDDDFEADMAKELSDRVKAAEEAAALVKPSDSFPLPGEGEDAEDMDDAAKAGDEITTNGKYSDIYFDSDEDDSEERKVKTNDELFYDPDKDEEDQMWVDDVRRSYHQSTSKSTIPTPALKPLPNSDAVLNCPACFTVVCMDCQRHAVYKTQYRAMFVINCSVLSDQKLRFPLKSAKKRKGKGKLKTPVLDPNEEFHPVKCDQCKTEVAMYDQDEVYHFFNVVASHT